METQSSTAVIFFTRFVVLTPMNSDTFTSFTRSEVILLTFSIPQIIIRFGVFSMVFSLSFLNTHLCHLISNDSLIFCSFFISEINFFVHNNSQHGHRQIHRTSIGDDTTFVFIVAVVLDLNYKISFWFKT